jgi:hypothetical protein
VSLVRSPRANRNVIRPLSVFLDQLSAKYRAFESLATVLTKPPRKRNTNIAADPSHSQKPRCQKTECRRTLRIGTAQLGFSRVRSNKDSLRKIPPKDSSVTSDQVQNKRAGSRFFLKPFHAHQQALNMLTAMNPAAERAMDHAGAGIRTHRARVVAQPCTRK